VIRNPNADRNHHQWLITSRGSSPANVCQVWSTSVSAFVSYPVYRITEWQKERTTERSHYICLVAKLLNRLQAVINTAARLVCHAITLHLRWKTYTGYESRKGSSTSYVSLRSSVNIVWHHPTCPSNFNKTLECSPDNVWDRRVRQRSSYHLLEGRHCRGVVGDRAFLVVAAGRETVCRQQSLLRQPCIHFVEPWKLIYSPHLSHHLSYIISFICILS